MAPPTLQRHLGLSVAQTGWCLQALYGAARGRGTGDGGRRRPVARRPLLVWGALGWGIALLVVAGAPSFGWLAAAFLLMGAASGPLAQTTDVLLVEMHPGAEERIGARQTMLDTTGALLTPAAVALAGWAGADPRLPLVVAGCVILGYAGLLAATPRPGPHAPRSRRGRPRHPHGRMRRQPPRVPGVAARPGGGGQARAGRPRDAGGVAGMAPGARGR